MKNEVIEILMMEDDPGDIRLTRESFKEAAAHVLLHSVVDGIEGLDYLRRMGKYAQAKTPDLILLDLNMPRMDGRKVLNILKNDIQLKLIPVIIMTTSERERDVFWAYSAGANCFIVKPVDFDQFQKVVKLISDFWLTVVKLPKGQP